MSQTHSTNTTSPQRHYTVSDSYFCFQFFSVQGGNSTDDVKIHSSEVKMYSADVKN